MDHLIQHFTLTFLSILTLDSQDTIHLEVTNLLSITPQNFIFCSRGFCVEKLTPLMKIAKHAILIKHETEIVKNNI